MKKIDDLLGHTRQRIQAIGIELEGGWRELPKGIPALEHDGSVAIRQVGIQHVGELPSPPLNPKEWSDWLVKHYPHAVNATCGMHVHVSFRSALLYQRLMVPDLTKETIRLVQKWAEEEKLPKDHPLWARLRGESQYCQNRFDAELQTKTTRKGHDRGVRGNRYTIWNYCFAVHSTMECRLLPMMESSQQACRAIQHLLNIVNAFLVTHAKREQPYESLIIADESSLLNEVSLCV